MHHFFVENEQIIEREIRITGPDVNHIKNVLRMKPGETVRIGTDGGEEEYLCEIRALESDCVLAGILEVRRDNRELPSKIYLFQGLPKGDKMEWIIQKAVELGAYEVIPVATRRSVVKLDAKKEQNKLKRWAAVSESAAKQSGRMCIPRVAEVMEYSRALEYARNLDHVGIPYERAEHIAETQDWIDAVLPGQSVGIFIGPEGGFEEGEIEAAMALGVRPLTLGKRILRTETAGLALLSALMLHLECETAKQGKL